MISSVKLDKLQAAFLLFWLYLFNVLDGFITIWAIQNRPASFYEANPLGFQLVIYFKMVIPVLLYYLYVKRLIDDKIFVGIVVVISLICLLNILNIYNFISLSSV